MKMIIFIFLFINIIFEIDSIQSNKNIVFQTSFYFDGKNYELIVMEDILNESPNWEENDDHPPLSPRKASINLLKYANENLIYGDWHINKISLIPIGAKNKWIYLVELFPPLPEGGSLNGSKYPVQLIILMNGFIIPIKPQIK